QQPDGIRWSLTREARQAVLASSERQELVAAAKQTAARFHDPVSVALRGCLEGTRRRNLASMSQRELETTRIAVTWLRDRGDLDLPRLVDLDRRIALRRVLAPFERMVGRTRTTRAGRDVDRFFG